MGKRHSQEFKDQAVALVKGSGKSLEAVARDLGVHSQTLRYWVAGSSTVKKIEPESDLQTNEPMGLRLALNEARERIRILEMEKEILKKAAAFFAKENQ